MLALRVGRNAVGDGNVDGGRCCARSMTADVVSKFVYGCIDISKVIVSH